jgi:hypothetical protein
MVLDRVSDTMRPWHFFIAAYLAFVVVSAFSATHLRAQSAECVWYADMALKQQQRNEHRKCGFKGPEWSSDRRAHLAWCAMQTPEHWKAEAQKRERMLGGCK